MQNGAFVSVFGMMPSEMPIVAMPRSTERMTSDVVSTRTPTVEDLHGEPYVSFLSDVLGGPHMGPVTAVLAIGSFGQQVRALAFNVEEVMRLVIANAGIGMLPQHLTGQALERGDLWQLPPYAALPMVETFRITNPAATFNPAERAFLAHVAEVPLWVHDPQHHCD